MNEKFYRDIDKNLKKEQEEHERKLKREWEEKLFPLAFERAQKVFKDQIQIEDFADLYGEETVRSDLKKSKLLKELHEITDREEGTEEVKKLSLIFEAIFNHQSEANEWLGENVSTIIASIHDDQENGIDTIAEFKQENESKSHLALAIDVTISTSGVGKKLDKIKRDIRNGLLSKVKYFATEDFRGELKNVPKVIIGVDVTTLREVADLWVQNKNKELADHPVVFQILLEIQMQLEAFREYAEANNQEKSALAYERSLSIINKIIEKRGGEESADLDLIRKDSAFNAIKNYIDSEFEQD